MKSNGSKTQDEIEKFKFELADELGIIEQTDRGSSGRNSVKPHRPPRHRHINRKKK